MPVLYDNAMIHPSGYREIDPVRVAQARGTVRVVDVREPAEFVGELGHAPGAEIVPLATIESAARTWDKEQEIVLVCRSGARSGRAADLLARMGFRRPMNMVGGMIAWQEARLGVER
jgi:sulfur-carrier protein adenylyltransferase/sulfurtransferase